VFFSDSPTRYILIFDIITNTNTTTNNTNTNTTTTTTTNNNNNSSNPLRPLLIASGSS